MRKKRLSNLCQRRSVAKRLFDSVLANNQIFLNITKEDRRRLENKTPREITNMDRKTERTRLFPLAVS